MGAGASVLQGSPIGVEVRSPFGASITFPPDHWVWAPRTPSAASLSTEVESGIEEAPSEESEEA